MEYNENLVKKWQEEQQNVASQAIIPDDASWNLDDPYVTRQDNGDGCDICFKNIPNNGCHETRLYGGVDVSFPSNNESKNCDLEQKAIAVYVIMKGTNIVYQDWEIFDLKIPYISSYLSFREIDPLERLVKKQLKERPDLSPEAILVDGNGIFHCRRAGIAVFLGVRTGIKTIGIGKSFYYNNENRKNYKKGLTLQKLESSLLNNAQNVRKRLKETNDYLRLGFDKCSDEKQSKHFGLIISHPRITDEAKSINDIESSGMKKSSGWVECFHDISKFSDGFAVKLELKKQICGAVLVSHGGKYSKSKVGTKNPIYVSIGNNISLEESLQVCSELSYSRIPEPVRKADLLGRELIRNLETARN